MPDTPAAGAASSSAPPPPASTRPPAKPPAPEPKDLLREWADTIVFVVVLVLLLKSFVAEAFVIPSGSMATTLLGDHRLIECEKCRTSFTVNAHKEGVSHDHAMCPSCRHIMHWQVDPAWPQRFVYVLIMAGFGLIFVVQGVYMWFAPLEPAQSPPNTSGSPSAPSSALPAVPWLKWGSWQATAVGALLVGGAVGLYAWLHDPNELHGGEKVLVSKYQYALATPQRWDVAVFKFPGYPEEEGPPRPPRLGMGLMRDPQGPQEDYQALNYIKRIVGLPGEVLIIGRGDVALETVDPATGKERRDILRKPAEKMLAMRRPVYNNERQARDLGPAYQRWRTTDPQAGWTTEDGKEFRTNGAASASLRYQHVLRPLPPLAQLHDLHAFLESPLNEAAVQALAPPEVRGLLSDTADDAQYLFKETLALADNLASPDQLKQRVQTLKQRADRAKNRLPRLQDALRQGLEGRQPPPGFGGVESLQKALDSLSREFDAFLDLAIQPPPQLITDVLSYNLGFTFGHGGAQQLLSELRHAHWVGDLMFEFEIDVTQPSGELVLDLIEGPDVCRAIFNLQTGECVLQVERAGVLLPLEGNKARTALKGTGSSKKHHVRFANVDDRLMVWVDDDLPWRNGVDYPSPAPEAYGPGAGDLRPIGIEARNAAVAVRHLQVWRDVYYTRTVSPDVSWDLQSPSELYIKLSRIDEETSRTYSNDRGQRYSVPREHYFALGDNSTHSKDSRDRFRVHERYLLGKAVFVYWPWRWERFGMIR